MASAFADVDDRPLSAFHWVAMLTTGMGVFCDGYDISSISLVLGDALRSYGVAHMASVEGGRLTAAALVGSMLGAAIFGLLGQRGRKRFYGLDVLILGVAAIAQAFMPSLGWLIACRFVLGIGVGGDYVLSPTIMAEHANKADRGKLMAIGFGVMWPLGALAAAVFKLCLDAFHLPPDLVWRIVLAGGAVPAFAIMYSRRAMPETARFLACAAEEDAARAAAGAAGLPARADWRPILRDLAAHARPIAAATLLWFVFDLVSYAGALFGPNLIAQNLGIPSAVYSIMAYVLFQIPATLVMAWFVIDRVGRKPLQVWGFVGAAAVLVVFALMRSSPGSSPVAALGVYLLFYVAQTGPGLVSGAGIYGVELAPTRIRSVAQSITVFGGRIGAAISGFAFPVLVGKVGLIPALYGLAAIAVAGAVLSKLLVPETSSRSLEDLSLQPAPAAAL